MREHGRHPRLAAQGEWQEHGSTETGAVLREQAITLEDQPGALPWRRIELTLNGPTEDGDATIRLWSNLPRDIGAKSIAALYRTRWRIESMFGRLESVLNSELRSLGHPRAALLDFAASVLAYNVLALLGRCVEQAHQHHQPPLDVSIFHLALLGTGSYEGMLIAVPPECWPPPNQAAPDHLAKGLLALARHISPRAVATSKRKPKPKHPRATSMAKPHAPRSQPHVSLHTRKQHPERGGS